MCAKYSCSMHIDLKNTSYFQAIILGEKMLCQKKIEIYLEFLILQS